jgi:DNA-binding MarR family transcriptional regulator/GNAT superfamily N-acetyltransferase
LGLDTKLGQYILAFSKDIVAFSKKRDPLSSLDDRVTRLRSFNRFYTGLLGLLRDGLLDTPYSLPESRVLFELGSAGAASPTNLAERLQLNPGYVSRILSSLKEQCLVGAQASPEDGRRQVVSLTKRGGKAFELLDERSGQQVRDLLMGLGEDEQDRLMSAVGEIESLLSKKARVPLVVLRGPHSGDYGWVIQRHGVLYDEEYGWDKRLEALVARIVADFIEHDDAEHEAAWIAEVDGVRVGCIFCMKKDEEVAQLRLLLMEPGYRGMGIGGRLVDECIRFAKRAGYKQMVLWTNDVLVDARRIYERLGFRLVEEERHHNFGKELVGQNWLLEL